MRRGKGRSNERVAEGSDRKPGVLGTAGRKAFKLLRQTRTRAKLGSLHLPISLHPLRQQPIVLPVSNTESPPVESTPGSLEADVPVEQTRALRSRLAVAERRTARLRYALERERQARALAGAALQRPEALIEQLVADLAALDRTDPGALREAVTSVLAAYGFRIPVPGEEAVAPAAGAGGKDAPPSIPGWDRRRLQALTAQLLAERPNIGGRRYIYLSLEALVAQGSLTPAQLAGIAGLTSPLARHRLRLALEALCAAGIARQDGPRFVLVPPAPTA